VHIFLGNEPLSGPTVKHRDIFGAEIKIRFRPIKEEYEEERAPKKLRKKHS